MKDVSVLVDQLDPIAYNIAFAMFEKDDISETEAKRCSNWVENVLSAKIFSYLKQFEHGNFKTRQEIIDEIRLPVMCFGRPLPNAYMLEMAEKGQYAVFWKNEQIAIICRKYDGLMAVCDWFAANGKTLP